MTAQLPKIAYIVAPSGQKGGGMGRVKDYILQMGGDAQGRVMFSALDTRGDGSALASLWKLFLALCVIVRATLAGRIAFVHLNAGDRGSMVRKGVVALVCRALHVPTVLHLHAAELLGHYSEANGVLRWLIRQPFQAATCVVVIGMLWRDWLVRDLGIDAGKIEVVYNGVPVETATQVEGVDPRVHDAVVHLLFLGNLMERKGVSDLLRALALLPSSAPAWQLTLAGGGDLAHYRKMVTELRLIERVHFAGWVEQAAARTLLHNHHVLLLPSYDEGLPLVILEALGSGMAVIATAVGSIPEVLEDQRNALFVDVGNSRDIADKIMRLLQDRALLGALGTDGIRLYRERFTLSAFGDGLFAVYRKHCGVDIERQAP